MLPRIAFNLNENNEFRHCYSLIGIGHGVSSGSGTSTGAVIVRVTVGAGAVMVRVTVGPGRVTVRVTVGAGIADAVTVTGAGVTVIVWLAVTRTVGEVQVT